MNTYEKGILTLDLPVSLKTADVAVALMIQREGAHNHIPWETVWNLGDSSRCSWISANAREHKAIPLPIIKQVVYGGTASDIRSIVWYIEGTKLDTKDSQTVKRDFLATLATAPYKRLAKVWNAVLTYSANIEAVVKALPGPFLPMALVILDKRMKEEDNWRSRDGRKRGIIELITNRLRAV